MSNALTKTEQDALFAAMANFGPCTCSQPGKWPRRTCDGHRFLDESTKYANRIDMLLYVRRTRLRYIHAELMTEPDLEPVAAVPEPEPLLPVAPDALPW